MKINEVSKKLSLPISTLHYYERVGLIIPSRGQNNYRYYTEEDCSNLMLISIMKNFGFAIQEIKDVMNRYTVTDPTEEVVCDAKNFFENKIETLKMRIAEHNEVIKIIESLPILSKDKIDWKMKKDSTMKLAFELYQKIS
jgi:Predicted transcriptional regulators